MKKRKIVAILAILLIVALSFITGQTYAKYLSQMHGEGVAEVASWNFKVNGQEETVQTINLASTINNDTLVNNKIAPGTSGEFNIIIDATGSEVGINYNIAFENESGKPSNLEFIYNGIYYNSIQSLEEGLSGSINANDKDKIKTINIKWVWNYEKGTDPTSLASNDELDTNDGKTLKNYKVDITVSGVQVVPQ